MTVSKKIYEILFKPYSKDVRGYFFTTPGGRYIVVNSNLPEADVTQATLEAAAENFPNHSFILLHGDGQLYKSEDFDINILERAC